MSFILKTPSHTQNGHVFPASARDAFLIYFDRDVRTIPLPHQSKIPTISGWPDLRITPADRDRYFPTGEDRNQGALLGPVSGNLADVDLDVPEAIAAKTLLPATGWVFGRKSAPSSHHEYRVVGELKAATYKDEDGKMLVELRYAGQTVYPPSVHQDTGEPIRWEKFTDRAEVPAVELETAVARVAAAALLARHWPTKGNRHDAVNHLAGGLLRAGWSVDDVDRFIAAIAEAIGCADRRDFARAAESAKDKLDKNEHVTGWPKLAELVGNWTVTKVRDWLLPMIKLPAASSKSKVKFRTVAPYRTFPTEHLPDPLRTYVVQAAAALGADPAFVALPVLATVASAIGNTRVIVVKPGWTEPCIVWAAPVADSGTLKTPGYLKAVRHLFAVQKRNLTDFRAAMAKYKTDLDEWKRKKRDNPEDAGDPPEEPMLRRVIVSDVTIEKLAEVLEDNPRGVLLGRDELAGWFGSFSRYKGKAGGSDMPNWLEAHRGGVWMIDRKTGDRKHYFVPRASVSLTGTIQPGVLASALTPEVLESGLAARLLLAMPDKQAKRWSEAEVDMDVETEYHDLLDKLLALDFKDVGGEPTPQAIKWSPEAKRVWVAFYNEWADEQAAAEGEVAAALSKLEGYAARFALIHHLVGHVHTGTADTTPISDESIRAGVALCRWFAAEARRVLSIVTETNEERDIRRLVEFIRVRGGRMTVKKLQLSNARKYPTAEAAESALEVLVGAGLGTWKNHPVGPRGGRPTKEFILSDPPNETYETPDDGPGADAVDEPSAPNETPAAELVYHEKQAESGVSLVSLGGVPHVEAAGVGQELGGDPVGGFVGPTGVSLDASYILIRDVADLSMVVSAVSESGVVGLDIETTGLNPRTDRARLLTLACDNVDGGTTVYVVDLFALDPAPLWEPLASVPIVGHNLLFDLSFLTRLGLVPGECRDTMLMSQVIYAGDRSARSHKLADCVTRELKETVSKEEQTSDWSGDLTPAQLAYAAKDAEIVRRLHDALAEIIDGYDLTRAVAIEHAALPALAWMSGAGVGFNREKWNLLAADAKAEAERLTEELHRNAPATPRGALFDDGWNWDSPKHVAAALNAAGCPVGNTDDDTLAAIDIPLAGLLRDHRAAKKRATTYGVKWIKGSYADGRVYAGWRQLGADSGRMSCSAPNLQNLPRDPRYRQCFTAPEGRMLVKADYSQIELRIAAKIADESAMKAAYVRGDDLHTLTARRLVGREDVSRDDRQLAKALNFGLLYGMGAPAFRVYAHSNYGVHLTEKQAQTYRAEFFKAYPGLKRWHASAAAMTRDIETRTLAGRRRCNVVRFTEKLNTPVQGTGADGLKAALGLLWQRRDQCPGAVPVLAVHDEIVVECDADQGDAVAAWLKQAMVDGMAPFLPKVPVEVEVKISNTWEGSS
jgi:DNA polymerase I-like protein with 3'-5' exonuclease and polymerase domains